MRLRIVQTFLLKMRICVELHCSPASTDRRGSEASKSNEVQNCCYLRLVNFTSNHRLLRLQHRWNCSGFTHSFTLRYCLPHLKWL